MAKDDGSGTPYDPKQTGQQFGSKLSGYLNDKAPVFDENLYTGLGPDTLKGFEGMRQVANGSNGGFRQAFDIGDMISRDGGMDSYGLRSELEGVSDATNDYRNMADSFATPGGEPGYQTLRNKLKNDVTTESLGAFNNSGMFGSDANQESLAEGLGNALGGLDYQNYNQAIQNRNMALQGQMAGSGQGFGMRQTALGNAMGAGQSLGGLYDQMLRPSQTLGDVGTRMDADAQGRKLGEFDQFNRRENADYNRFQELLGAFNGAQQNAGMKEEVPWYQQLIGYVLGNAGQAAKAYGGM